MSPPTLKSIALDCASTNDSLLASNLQFFVSMLNNDCMAGVAWPRFGLEPTNLGVQNRSEILVDLAV